MSDDDDTRRDIVPRRRQTPSDLERSAFEREIEVYDQDARDLIDGKRLLTHNELDRAHRQLDLGLRSKAARRSLAHRDSHHRVSIARKWAALGVFLAFAVVAIVLALTHGITFADVLRAFPR
ncbi:MAG: hypothetical protein ABW167_02910 [Baekduia sp.]